jgi:1,4-alpha-glucan branching enzyme
MTLVANRLRITKDHIAQTTPLGANLLAGGATFSAWAPRALEVHLMLNGDAKTWTPTPSTLLVPDKTTGVWSGFVPNVKDGDRYRFFVVGQGGSGFKRDPYARELGPNHPDCDCIVRDPSTYNWHDNRYQRLPFKDLIVYQFHVGTFYRTVNNQDDRPNHIATLLDALERMPDIADLGVNAVEPLPIDECVGDVTLGYNGTDYFSPEEAYMVPVSEIGPYFKTINQLLALKGLDPLQDGALDSHVGQIKAFVDVCHAYGLAVLFDVVYNHAGGPFDDQSLYFFDRAKFTSNADSLYFSTKEWAGGLGFQYDQERVRELLINNTLFWMSEYHVDGFRYDEVTVIDGFGGWGFCQQLSDRVHQDQPAAINIAEYWRDDQSWVVKPTRQQGAGFDVVWYAGLRGAIRDVLAQAAGGSNAFVNLDPVRDNLGRPNGFAASWQALQHLENHDKVRVDSGDREPRIAALAGGNDSRSWWGRSRTRVATGLLLTAPGIPMLFMGQEFLEDKPWSENPKDHPGTLIWWQGLDSGSDKAMVGQRLFTRDVAHVRLRYKALRGESINTFHVRNDHRVIAFHRWVEFEGRDVVVVASLNEFNQFGYVLGFPQAGQWLEVLNGDVHDNGGNPNPVGNGGFIWANGPSADGLPYSAAITIPANGFLVFARNLGD